MENKRGLLLTEHGGLTNMHDYNSGWYELIKRVHAKYNCVANYETYCQMRYMGIDAAQRFYEGITKIENESNKET